MIPTIYRRNGRLLTFNGSLAKSPDCCDRPCPPPPPPPPPYQPYAPQGCCSERFPTFFDWPGTFVCRITSSAPVHRSGLHVAEKWEPFEATVGYRIWDSSHVQNQFAFNCRWPFWEFYYLGCACSGALAKVIRATLLSCDPFHIVAEDTICSGQPGCANGTLRAEILEPS